MEESVKRSLMLINTDLDIAKELEAVYRHKPKFYSYWQGRRQALEKSSKLLTNILNSENKRS
jgi:hypothetical protein